MSESESQPESELQRGDNLERAEQIEDHLAQEEREQTEAVAEAEQMKRRIMEDRASVDDDAEPVSISFQDYGTLEFRPLPEKAQVWVENTSFDLVGVAEDDLAEGSEQAKKLSEVRDHSAELLGTHETTGVFDETFWRENTTVEERIGLIFDITDRVDTRSGNRR